MPGISFSRLVLITIFIRLAVGPLSLISIKTAALISFFSDWADSEIYKASGFSYPFYSSWDKFLDYYWYTFILIYILKKNLPAKNFFLFLFLIRSFGQILYFLTQNQAFFFFFPNIFEVLFYFYLLSICLPKLRPLLKYPKILLTAGVITLLLVLPREYLVHIKKINLSGFFTGKTTYWVEGH